LRKDGQQELRGSGNHVDTEGPNPSQQLTEPSVSLNLSTPPSPLFHVPTPLFSQNQILEDTVKNKQKKGLPHMMKKREKMKTLLI